MENKTTAIVKAKRAKEFKNKMMLYPSFLNAKQLLHILQQTPQNHIYKRKGKGGGEWEYVTGTYIKKVLNYTFGWRWDFEIKEHGKECKLVWVKGRLTIRDKKGNPVVVKEQFGRADIKFKKGTNEMLDYGNDLKAAATDALKKCASELGIASDIYGKGEFKEIQAKGYQTQQGGSEGADSNEEMFAEETVKERIGTIARELNCKTIKDIEKKTGLNINWKSMTKVQASKILYSLMKIKAKK